MVLDTLKLGNIVWLTIQQVMTLSLSHTTPSMSLNKQKQKGNNNQELFLFSQNLYKFQISKSSNHEYNQNYIKIVST